MSEVDKGGRPKIPIDFAKLADMCAILCTKAECAHLLGCSEDTIDRRLVEETGEGFAAFYEKHSSQGKSSLRRAQFSTAMSGNATMQIWLGKQWLGQRDTQYIAGDEEAAPLVVNMITRAAVGDVRVTNGPDS